MTTIDAIFSPRKFLSWTEFVQFWLGVDARVFFSGGGTFHENCMVFFRRFFSSEKSVCLCSQTSWEISPFFFYQTPLGLCPFCSVIMYLCIFPVPGNLPFFLFWSHPVRPVYLHEVGAFCFELSSVETREQIWKIYPFKNNLLMWVVFKRNFCNWLLPAAWESRVTALTILSLSKKPS